MTGPQITPCASGGAVVDFPEGPRWFTDWRTAIAEVAARTRKSPTGPTGIGTRSLPDSPRLGRSGSTTEVAA